MMIDDKNKQEKVEIKQQVCPEIAESMAVWKVSLTWCYKVLKDNAPKKMGQPND